MRIYLNPMTFFQGTRTPQIEGSFLDANIARFYDEHAQRFMGPVYRRFVAKATALGTAGNRVLDIGTGSGRLAIELAKSRSDWQITGIDISEDMLELARQNVARSGLTGRIDFRQASATALPFADDSFTLVTSYASLHLWADPLKVFQEIARVTSPGGFCLIRDNLRVTRLNPLLSWVGRMMGMNASQRRLWIQAISSSYTVGEAQEILRESALKDARVVFSPIYFQLGIEWRKRLQR